MLRLRNTYGAFWITPGGGQEPGESDSQTLARELREETGLLEFDEGPCLWTRETTFVLGRNTANPVNVAQSERFYLIHTDKFAANADGMPQEAERDWFTEFGWHSVAALESLPERVVPTGLAAHLDALFEHGVPATPFAIGR